MDKKYYVAIIGGLLLFIIVLYFLLSNFQNTPETNNSGITPTETPGPTITPVQINYTFPTLAPAVQTELLYPVKYENMTIEYKPRSGTFLIYYQGNLNQANGSANRFFSELNIDPNSYRVEYRSLDPVSLPPKVELEVP